MYILRAFEENLRKWPFKKSD